MAKKILVVDDSLTVRKFIERTLMQQPDGYQVTMAHDAAQGLSLATSSQPDLILLDFVLPDMRGDAVCNELLQNRKTARIPVILMSSNADDIKKMRSQYPNAVNAVSKPFTPELLSATVAYVFKNMPTRQSPAATAAVAAARASVVRPATSHIAFRAHTGFFSITDALRTIEKDRLNGALRVFMGKIPIEAYAQEGRIALVTNRDPKLYLQDSTFEVSFSKTNVWAACEKGQRDSGCPLFILMVERGLFTKQMMIPMVEIHGHRLFSRLWTAGQVNFEFEEMTTLPSYVSAMGTPEIMDNWILKTTRYVGHECAQAMHLGDPTGTPGFTRFGYEDIHRVKLNHEEHVFASLVNGTNTLPDISREMGISMEMSIQILFRFLCLEIMEYWPSSILAASAVA